MVCAGFSIVQIFLRYGWFEHIKQKALLKQSRVCIFFPSSYKLPNKQSKDADLVGWLLRLVLLGNDGTIRESSSQINGMTGLRGENNKHVPGFFQHENKNGNGTTGGTVQSKSSAQPCVPQQLGIAQEHVTSQLRWLHASFSHNTSCVEEYQHR